MEFARDMRRIFDNSRKFHTDMRSEIYAKTTRLSNIFENEFARILIMYKQFEEGFVKKGSRVPRMKMYPKVVLERIDLEKMSSLLSRSSTSKRKRSLERGGVVRPESSGFSTVLPSGDPAAVVEQSMRRVVSSSSNEEDALRVSRRNSRGKSLKKPANVQQIYVLSSTDDDL